MYVSHFKGWQPLGCKHEIKAGNTKPHPANRVRYDYERNLCLNCRQSIVCEKRLNYA